MAVAAPRPRMSKSRIAVRLQRYSRVGIRKQHEQISSCTPSVCSHMSSSLENQPAFHRRSLVQLTGSDITDNSNLCSTTPGNCIIPNPPQAFPASVPQPTSAGLLLIGAVLFGWRKFRRFPSPLRPQARLGTRYLASLSRRVLRCYWVTKDQCMLLLKKLSQSVEMIRCASPRLMAPVQTCLCRKFSTLSLSRNPGLGPAGSGHRFSMTLSPPNSRGIR